MVTVKKLPPEKNEVGLSGFPVLIHIYTPKTWAEYWAMCQVPEQNMRMRNDRPKLLLLFIASFILQGSFYKVLVTIQFVMNNLIFVKDRLYPT